ncbi:MAG: glycerol-3-phosphate acyltransferase [Phototrophicaceae bacterium]
MSPIELVIIIIICYLIGSLPNAYLVSLMVKRINIFEVGSGNMGGTNVARSLGLGWGIFTVVLDSLKGLIAVATAQYIAAGTLSLSPAVAQGLPESLLIPSIAGALAAVAGHNWSFFATALFTYYHKKFGIRGGKGAATAFGSMVAILPFIPNVILLVVGISLAVMTRYASLSVLTCFTVAFAWVIGWAVVTTGVSNLYIAYVILLAILIVWRFRENIERLATGTERRIGERVEA